MGKFLKFNFTENTGNVSSRQFIRINHSKGIIDARIHGYKYIDKDTNHFVRYIPALELSGYGDTEPEADEMLKFAIEDFLKLLLSLKPEKAKEELWKYGWKRDRYFSKEYSKSFVDLNGELHLNAKENSLKKITMFT